MFELVLLLHCAPAIPCSIEQWNHGQKCCDAETHPPGNQIWWDVHWHDGRHPKHDAGEIGMKKMECDQPLEGESGHDTFSFTSPESHVNRSSYRCFKKYSLMVFFDKVFRLSPSNCPVFESQRLSFEIIPYQGSGRTVSLTYIFNQIFTWDN